MVRFKKRIALHRRESMVGCTWGVVYMGWGVHGVGCTWGPLGTQVARGMVLICVDLFLDSRPWFFFVRPGFYSCPPMNRLCPPMVLSVLRVSTVSGNVRNPKSAQLSYGSGAESSPQTLKPHCKNPKPSNPKPQQPKPKPRPNHLKPHGKCLNLTTRRRFRSGAAT